MARVVRDVGKTSGETLEVGGDLEVIDEVLEYNMSLEVAYIAKLLTILMSPYFSEEGSSNIGPHRRWAPINLLSLVSICVKLEFGRRNVVSKGLIISSILSCHDVTTVVDPVDVGVQNISAMRTSI